MIAGLVSAAAGVSETLLASVSRGVAELSQSRVLTQTGNRPWPLPDGPWLMAQTWRDLLFAHWALDPEIVRRALPPSLPVDTFDGRAWVGVTPFELSGLRPRGGPPLPGASRFPELNVRTYTTLDAKPGIFFLSLDAANPLAVLAARRAYRLPYFRARMAIVREANAVHYSSERVSPDGDRACFIADYRPTGGVSVATPGSLEYFLTERYCLYTVDESGLALRAQIQHPPWPLQPASANLQVNTMTRPWQIDLPQARPVLHYARLQNVLIWSLRPAGP